MTSPTTTSTWRALAMWAAIVVPIWVVMILCTHWEPVAHDGWGHFGFHRTTGLSPGSLVEFARYTYVHGNPRLGQVVTMLLFTPGPWHSIVTPIAELGMFYLLAAFVLGRWPSVRRADDALLFLVLTALVAITAPQFGLMLFYRPYTGNYLFGLDVNVLFLLPYRFAFEQQRARGWWWIPIMGVLGFASGMCNEHTGPAVVALAAAATYACWRRDRAIPAWMIVGLVAMIAGGIALFEAPGQALRYNGLANQGSLIGRVIGRGVARNLGVLGALVGYLLPTIPWIGLAIAARTTGTPRPASQTRRWTEVAAVAGAFLILVTLLASPKVGARLYLGSVALACAAIAGVVVWQLATRWSQYAVAALSAATLVFVGYKCVAAYSVLGPAFADRLDRLSHAPANSVLDLPSYPIERSRWALDDDLAITQIRNSVAFMFKLALIRLDGVGVADVPQADDP